MSGLHCIDEIAYSDNGDFYHVYRRRGSKIVYLVADEFAGEDAAKVVRWSSRFHKARNFSDRGSATAYSAMVSGGRVIEGWV